MGISRKIMIETRNRLENRETLDAKIKENFFSILPESVRRVFIYASSNQEADTKGIILELLSRGIHVYCPKVIEDRHMAFFEVTDLSELKPGYHKINEPEIEVDEDTDIWDIVSEKAVYPTRSEEDVCVVPGVIFDEDGNRMGYGFGFYDRFLIEHPVFKIALSYEIQIQPSFMDVPDETDIPMDMLVTEVKIRKWDRPYEENEEV